MTDYTKLIKDLREEAEFDHNHKTLSILLCAADALEAQAAEIERLNKENTDSLVSLATAIQHREGFRSQLNDLRHEMDDLEAEYSELQAKLDAAQAQEPIFYYRPTCNGAMYEGPHHAKSIGGRMLREEKPTEWVALYASPVVQPVDVAHMVNRFLAWKLPREFAPDGGITFHLMRNEGFPLPECWPIGTNLFTADQAKAMFEHCLQGASPVVQKPLSIDAAKELIWSVAAPESMQRDYAIVRATEKHHGIGGQQP